MTQRIPGAGDAWAVPGKIGLQEQVRHTGGSSFSPCNPSCRLCPRAGSLEVLRSAAPGESKLHSCGIWRLILSGLAALLFLVQVQDPHVGSSAACEEQKRVKAENVILALHPRGALTVLGSRTGAAQTDTGYSAGGGPESELHPHKSWAGRTETLCPAETHCPAGQWFQHLVALLTPSAPPR